MALIYHLSLKSAEEGSLPCQNEEWHEQKGEHSLSTHTGHPKSRKQIRILAGLTMFLSTYVPHFRIRNRMKIEKDITLAAPASTGHQRPDLPQHRSNIGQRALQRSHSQTAGRQRRSPGTGHVDVELHCGEATNRDRSANCNSC